MLEMNPFMIVVHSINMQIRDGYMRILDGSILISHVCFALA